MTGAVRGHTVPPMSTRGNVEDPEAGTRDAIQVSSLIPMDLYSKLLLAAKLNERSLSAEIRFRLVASSVEKAA